MFYQPRKHDPKRDMGFKHDPWKALVQPRPIGWISTISKDGFVNLAPYSFYNAISSDPPMVMFSSSSKQKNTAENILQTGEFVINGVTDSLLEQMVETSRSVAADVDEFELAHLTKRNSSLVKPPAVAESPFHLECILYKTVPLPSTDPDSDYILILGEVIGIYINEQIIKEGIVDFISVGRLGYQDYSLIDKKVSLSLK